MGNPLGRFFEFIRNPSYSRTTTLLVILTIALAIPLTVFVAQQQQETRQQAACSVANDGRGCGNLGGICSNGVCFVGDNLDANGSLDCQVCTTPTSTTQIQDTCTPNGGTCVDNCQQADGSLAQGTCSAPGKVCCKLPGGTSISRLPASGTGGTPTSSPTTATEGSLCKTNAGWNGRLVGGICTENKDAVLQLTGPGQALPVNKLSCTTPTCLRGTPTKRSDESWYCFEGERFVGNAFCEGKSQESIGVNLSPKKTCTGTATCTDGCTAVKSVNNEYYCVNAADTTKACAVPDCQTAASANTQIAFTIGLDGLGKTGDLQSRRSGRNEGVTPRRNEREKLLVEVFDPRITDPNGFPQRVFENFNKTEKVSYNSQNGKFEKTVDLGKTLTGGNYKVKVRVQGYLVKLVDIAITSGQTANVSADLITGDVDFDNKLSILDYNAITQSCFGKAASGSCQASDLDDSGTVDELDYNLFLREFNSGQREGDQFVVQGQ